ncbi:MAG: hypothetical protein R3F54_31405 [Alphaproteobacteria bacterium]
MSTNRKAVLASTALVTGVLAATALYAHESGNARRAMMGQSMMHDGAMMGGEHSMMGTCRQMMASMSGDAKGRRRPNAQWSSPQTRSE